MTASERVDPPRTLFADALEAWNLGDSMRDKVTLVGALTMRKVRKLRPGRAWTHVITLRSGGILVTLDVWAAEHRPLREIIARDEYGIMRGELLAPGGVVIDVGANIGVFSLISAVRVGPTGMVIAFEPHPRAFARLVRNVEQNQASQIITPVNAAVSSEAGTMSFDPNTVTVENSVDVAGAVSVQAVKLDEDPRIAGLDHVDMLKVDVEGHEVSVLMGAAQTLMRTNHAVVEYQSEENRKKVIDSLRDAGLTTFVESHYGVDDGLISARRPAS